MFSLSHHFRSRFSNVRFFSSSNGSAKKTDRNARYDVLFEPVQIGPKTAKNRFYQVPHCTGLGRHRPRSMAYLRWVKAQGGWGVVNTELCSIHPSTECDPTAYASLWNDSDVDALSLMTQLLKREGCLSGVELYHGGAHHSNIHQRVPPMSVSGSVFTSCDDPIQTMPMDRADIRAVRKYHREAAKRAVKAGFDIVYVYPGHQLLPLQFLSTKYNRRTDEYGGSVENRTRFVRELLEETRDAVGSEAAVAIRIALDDFDDRTNISHDGEMKEIIASLAPLPDLWDVSLTTWQNDSQTSRFAPNEGYQEKYYSVVKQLVGTKPVVGTGRFTSPDEMVRQIRSGNLDFIGAARPSIADPYLPNKINEGREDDIRECIGCNICAASDNRSVPIRCTQNPTMGEEYRRGWHPEIMPPKGSDDSFLVVGAGPAGLECALTLARRGYDVTLAEATETYGGRVERESRLLPLRVWKRVSDWRLGQLAKLPNVQQFKGSKLTVQDCIDFDVNRVIVATGSTWRNDFVGRNRFEPLHVTSPESVVTPDIVMDNVNAFVSTVKDKKVVIVDEDQYYMASVLAELLARQGVSVIFVTSASSVSPYSEHTLEQQRIHSTLLKLGVNVVLGVDVIDVKANCVEICCTLTNVEKWPIPSDVVICATSRVPNMSLFEQLQAKLADHLEHAGMGLLTRKATDSGNLKSIQLIGDALIPATIQHAVYLGHHFARAADDSKAAQSWERRETVIVDRFLPDKIGLE